jgi:geranylgeranyl diphosphate synthase type II
MSAAAELEEILGRRIEEVNAALLRAVPEVEGPLGTLHEAMRYSLTAGGKRIRPALCLAACEAAGGEDARAIAPAVAIELVHTYSLIHDDLPCMDDDDLRRGRPTSHRVFGEAVAVLAGDALLTRAFGVLAEADLAPGARVEMIRTLAEAAGSRGMVGGQALDLAAQGEVVDPPAVRYIHACKTGALFGASCRLGGLAAGAGPEAVERLGAFGEKVGLAFQIVDDLLDESGRAEELGKAAGKDRARGKATYPGVLGPVESRRRVEELGRGAAGIAEGFGARGRALGRLARFIVDRSS